MRLPINVPPLQPLEPRMLLAAAAGDLDPAWGVGGVRVYDDIPAPAVGVATQSDGKFLVATGATVYRFKPDGSIDKSFGHRGHVAPGFTLKGLGVDHNGRIAVGGRAGGTTDHQWAAARYTPAGVPDTTFNGTGQNITHVNGAGEEWASVMTLQPDGKILVGGVQFNGNNDPLDDFNFNAVVVRFDSDGTVDTSFGTNGEAFDSPMFNVVNTIATAPNGDILLAGRSNAGMTTHDEYFQIVNAAGRFVTGTPVNSGDNLLFSEFRAAAYRPDGTRVLAADEQDNPVVYSGTSHADDVAFNPTNPLIYSNGQVNAIVTTADNKILLAGDAGSYNPGLGLQRFNPDLTPDNTFGFGGSSVIDLNRKKAEWIDRLALLPGGDLLAAGTIGAHASDANGEGGDPGHLFVAHIKGGAHPVGDLPPRAALAHVGNPAPDALVNLFTVTYAAEGTIDSSTIDDYDVRIVGPNGYSARAKVETIDDRYNGRQRIVVYNAEAPGGTWNRADNGTYTIYLRKGQVFDNRGHAAPGQVLGTFRTYFPRGRHTATATTASVSRALPVLPPTRTSPQTFSAHLLRDLFDEV